MARAEPYPSTLYLDAEELPARCESIAVLARFALIAREHGLTLTVRHATAELLDLIEFVGLSDVLLPPRSSPPLTPR